MFEIRKAKENEYEAVRDFYYELIDMMQGAEYHPMWQKGIYPEDEYIESSVINGDLFVGICNEKIVAAAVANHSFNEGYDNASWAVSAEADQITVIHTLGVLPSYSGKGYAKKMVAHIIEFAKQNNQKVVRLDVLSGNIPAERLYTNAGFKHMSTVELFYEDTGRVNFKLYEYTL